MVDFLHKVGIRSSSPDKVYEALATREGLSGWWAERSNSAFGSGGFGMKVLELDRDKHVLWQVVDGPAEWIGTRVSFDLRQEDDWTIVLFKQQGWKEPVEFMHHCSTKWGSSC